MKKLFKMISSFFNNRLLILAIILVVIALVFLIQLFNLQILHGKEYRDRSEKKMLRTEVVTAARGEIYDRNGVVLATNKLSFDVQIYKVKVDNTTQNSSIAKLIQILELNSDSIYSTFPISDDLKSFNFLTDVEEKSFKEKNKIDISLTFDEVISYYAKKYDIVGYDDVITKKIIQVRYEASINGYSLFNSAVVAKDISAKSVAMIEESKANLLGIETISVPKRYYPNGEMAAHTIGYVSKISTTEYANLKDLGYTYNSIVGKLGIEQTFEKYLKGTNGVKKLEVNSTGSINSESISKEPVSGSSINLTIDYRLQKVTEESLKNTIRDISTGTKTMKKVADANAGAVVVLDTLTGEVLAMASYPTFDLNSFVGGISNKLWQEIMSNSVRPMYNRAISGTYSPGSTYKMLVGLAALKKGVVTIDEKVQDLGVYPYGHNPKCWIYKYYHLTHGYVNISEAIKVSCNYFFYEMGRRLGIESIVEFSKIFGLGQKTGIELSNESSGQIAGDNYTGQWYLGDTLSAAIGQSYNSYTPIQLANYISTIANGGTLNKVSVIKQIQDSDGSDISNDTIHEFIKEYTGVDFQQNSIDLNPDYINAIKQGMYSVTSEQGGTSYIVFKGSNIQVAGKTGTAQVTTGSSNGIFVGFAPYDKPRIAVVAVIEHGDEGTYTANVVRPILETYFNITSLDKENEKVQNVSGQNLQY